MSEIDWSSAPADAEYFNPKNRMYYRLLGKQILYYTSWRKWEPSTAYADEIPAHFIKRPITLTKSTTPNTSVEFLDHSKNLQEQRGKQYDSPGGERSFDKVAAMFTAATGIALEGHHIALIQTHLKHVRAYSNTNKVHQDSLEDAVSYSALWAEEFKRTISKKGKL